MKNGLKILGALALVAGLGLTTGNVFANCQEGVGYPIIQCGGRDWFAPVPAGETLQTAKWWQLGYGNASRNATNPAASATNGTGFQAPVATNGCIGNDSGSLLPVEMDLVDATFVGGPPGSLCFSSASNWITPGNDGCADDSHQGGGGTAPNGGTFDDNLLNPYWGSALGPGYLYRDYQLDAPMGVLLTTQKSFALAFFATRSRGGNASDADSGDYDLRSISNGDPGLSGNNIIPWQPIPTPRVHATFTNPSDTSSPRILAIDWDPIRLINDGSSRPSPSSAVLNATGVGVLDQCPGNTADCLARFVLETAPVTNGSGACGTFTTALEVPLTQTNATLNNIPADTCVRLSIAMGRKPTGLPCVLANAATAKVGDVGYGVSSASTVVGGTLTSNKVTVIGAVRNKKGQTATISFTTASELNVSRLDVFGRNARGQEVLLQSVAPKQGTSGLGGSYSITLSKAAMKGARSVYVVSQPSGTRSNEVNLH